MGGISCAILPGNDKSSIRIFPRANQPYRSYYATICRSSYWHFSRSSVVDWSCRQGRKDPDSLESAKDDVAYRRTPENHIDTMLRDRLTPMLWSPIKSRPCYLRLDRQPDLLLRHMWPQMCAEFNYCSARDSTFPSCCFYCWFSGTCLRVKFLKIVAKKKKKKYVTNFMQ